MSTMAIPSWTASGALPPFNPASPTSTDRSPYQVALTDLVLRFNTSLERQTILTGFLSFRRALHELGLDRGFQWLDGSFLEDVELTENRPPRDLDVVTFFRLPAGQTQASLLARNRPLFTPTDTKAAFHVDAYFVQLDETLPESLVERSAYWYSLWSHRRSGEWKGYVQLDLSSADEAIAWGNLKSPQGAGG